MAVSTTSGVRLPLSAQAAWPSQASSTEGDSAVTESNIGLDSGPVPAKRLNYIGDEHVLGESYAVTCERFIARHLNSPEYKALYAAERESAILAHLFPIDSLDDIASSQALVARTPLASLIPLLLVEDNEMMVRFIGRLLSKEQIAALPDDVFGKVANRFRTVGHQPFWGVLPLQPNDPNLTAWIDESICRANTQALLNVLGTVSHGHLFFTTCTPEYLCNVLKTLPDQKESAHVYRHMVEENEAHRGAILERAGICLEQQHQIIDDLPESTSCSDHDTNYRFAMFKAVKAGLLL